MEVPQPKKRRLLLPILALVLILTLAFAFLLSSIQVCEFMGNSMAPTIRDGDIVLFQVRGFTPRQGDIVLLETPNFPPTSQKPAPIIKRVVATGGRHIRVDYAANAVYVDGVALEEPYVLEPMVDRCIPGMNILDVTVPEGSIYVLGDNRNNSSDSRHEALGCVPTEYILGRAIYILSF